MHLEGHNFTGFILPCGQQTVKLLLRVQTCLQLEYFAFQLCFRITMAVHGGRVQNQTLQCRRTGYYKCSRYRPLFNFTTKGRFCLRACGVFFSFFKIKNVSFANLSSAVKSYIL